MDFSKPQLSAIWPTVSALLKNGYSIIAVRDKADTIKGMTAKSPYSGWKEYQRRPPTEQELWNDMNNNLTTSVAVLCGRVSGNLEVIDIDNKNKPEIEKQLFSDISSNLSSLPPLRIHRSPSGGYHIFYKIQQDATVPGNKKLASRLTGRKVELKDGKQKDEVVSFFETRGEGGYVLIPPSPGYSIINNVPVPTLTWDQRCALINLCQSYNEVIKEEPKTPKEYQQRPTNGYYELNPFEDFNKSPEAETILTTYDGWKYYGQNSQFIWFTRPNTVSGGIHAAFLKTKRLYYFFTTNSVFENERCYQPATVLSILLHGGNKKLTHPHLVKLGYGKIAPRVESKIVEAAALSGSPLPANASPEAREGFKEATRIAGEKYPYGVFWAVGEETEGLTIEREGVYRVSAGLGFRYDMATGRLVQRVGNFLYTRDNRYYYDELKRYIGTPLNRDEICNAYEAFLQRSGTFTITRIQLLEENEILKDTRNECYKFYEDLYIKITAEGYTKHEYPAQGLIWADQVQGRKFLIEDGGVYKDFLCKALEYEKIIDYLELIIGYLSHNYRDETTGYIPVLIEQCEDPLQGGGSGKNLFCTLFKKNTTVLSVPGSQFKYDDTMLQNWHGERVYVISDVDRDFKFIFLKDPSTNDGKLKKLYVNIDTVPCSRMPKFVVLTNYSFEITDGGLKRRIIPLEFTDFFTKEGGVDVHYGMHFPNDWREEDWAGYDFIVVKSIQRWLAAGLKIPVGRVLTGSGWRKQFEFEFGKTIVKFIKDNWENWIGVKFIMNEDFKKSLDDFYNENGIAKNYQPSTFKINRALEVYANYNGYSYETDVKIRENGLQYKCRKFERIDNEEAPF